MARTKILVPPEKQCGYTSVIVSYSTGIDSTGAIYWATQNFAPEKIFLLYCDTGAEYSVNEALFFKTAKVLGLKPILLKAPKDFLYLLLNEQSARASLNVTGCAQCWTTKKARCLNLESVWDWTRTRAMNTLTVAAA